MLVIGTLLLFLGKSIFASTDCDEIREEIQHTLLLGGSTSYDYYDTSIELITPTMTCIPSMPELPSWCFGASAAMMGSKIYYCGGYSYEVQTSCHSCTLNENSGQWVQEDSIE